MLENKKTNLIFCHKLIKAFADSMVKAFVPLIILKESGSLKMAMFYCSMMYLLCFVLNVVLKKFLQKYGIVAMILHAFPIIIMQFLLTMKITWVLCLIIAVFAAFGQVLYSVPLNILFAFSDRKVNVAKFQIATNVGKLVFIVASGLVIGSNLKNSILILAVAGTVLYLLSNVPVVYGYKFLKSAYGHIAEHPPHLDKKTYRFFNVYHTAFSVFQAVIDVIVPLYLFTENLTFEYVAIIMALIEVCKIGANLFAKFLVKHEKQLLCMLFSLTLMVTGVILMIFIKNSVALYVFSCVIGVSFPLLFVPMFSSFCKKLKNDNNRFDGMSYRDIYIMFGKQFIYAPFFVFPSLIFQFVIGIGAATVVGVSCSKILVANKK